MVFGIIFEPKSQKTNTDVVVDLSLSPAVLLFDGAPSLTCVGHGDRNGSQGQAA